jgi:hypothetical protein
MRGWSSISETAEQQLREWSSDETAELQVRGAAGEGM